MKVQAAIFIGVNYFQYIALFVKKDYNLILFNLEVPDGTELFIFSSFYFILVIFDGKRE